MHRLTVTAKGITSAIVPAMLFYSIYLGVSCAYRFTVKTVNTRIPVVRHTVRVGEISCST